MVLGLLGRSRLLLEETSRACFAAGSRAVSVAVDVTKRDDVREAVRLFERDLGPIDLLVNNAGRIDVGEVPIWQTDPDDWWAVVETNLRGPYVLCRCVVPGMVERGRGTVVNLSTGMAIGGSAPYSAYSASKTALMRFTESLASDLAGTGVSVFDLAPGVVRTDMTVGMAIHRDRADDAWTPPERVTEAIAGLATGQMDALSGRFLHATRDDFDAMLAWQSWITEADARTLRLRTYGADDPLAGR